MVRCTRSAWYHVLFLLALIHHRTSSWSTTTTASNRHAVRLKRHRAGPCNAKNDPSSECGGGNSPDNNSNNSNNEDDPLDLGTPAMDWRDFRAKLVLGDESNTSLLNRSSSSSSRPPAPSSSSWAYDSGSTIEQGTILLSAIEQDFGYGIKQQYFHKCVVLVISHDESTFTKGILLNRPTNLVLSDEDLIYTDKGPLENCNTTEPSSSTWRMWYGGAVQGLYSDNPEIVCLHSLVTDKAKKISSLVMKDIRWTTLKGARKLVQDNEATSDDFLVFCGYAGWNAGQLMDELERDCWHLVATDSKTVWKELQASGQNASIDVVGMDTWSRLMDRIGRGDQAKDARSDFDDSMLRAWARKNLILNQDNSSDEESMRSTYDPPEVRVGSLLRASACEPSPFLLSCQEFHKSIVLVTQDEEDFTIGVLLNRPSDAVEFVVTDYDGERRVVKIPQRYGGRFGVKGSSEKPLFWFHYSQKLCAAGIGSPLGETGICRCTAQHIQEAIQARIASGKEFIAVKGFNVWPKGLTIGGMESAGFVAKAHFDLVPHSKTRDVWDVLVSQEALSTMTIDSNLMLGNLAWVESGGAVRHSIPSQSDKEPADDADTSLCDDALRCWMAAYLLDEPILRHTDSAFG